ncbi:MAG: methyltransferase domain-containing protein [Rhodobacteraceae bacterium]|nr:methyltransferase domain-containing protein [Paracoccaceae bacterium]
MSATCQSTAGDSCYQLQGDRPNLYEQWWVPAIMGPCAEDLVDTVCLRPGEKLLDVACGTGVVARAAARRGGAQVSVTGTDINEAMIETAQRYVDLDGLPNIRWRVGDAASLPFKTSTFDVVLCQQGLQFMPSRLAALREMARVLVPGGRLVASVWKSGSPFGTALRKSLVDCFGPEALSDWGVSISLGDRHKLRALAKDAGFEGCHVRYDVKIGRHREPEEFICGVIAASSLSGEFASLSAKDREKLVQSIIENLKNYVDDGGLAYPAECHTLTAQTCETG